jgi:hypothetical protein
MRHIRETILGPSMARRSRALTIALLLVASLMTLGAQPALASLKQDVQRFADCPLGTPKVNECVYSTTTSGEFQLGKAAVPINQTIVIQGGLIGHSLVPAADGNTLSKTALAVPGGILGIELLGPLTSVTATAELAGQGEIGSGVALPLKVKLDNPLLGGGCYLGSESEPVSLQLTYGTTNPPPPNKPISGKAVLTTKDHGAIVSIAGTLVDNAFAAPGANGCSFLPFLVDPILDLKEGLPAAAGTNTAIMNGTTEEVSSTIVANALPLPDLGRCQKVEPNAEGKKLVYHGSYLNSGCTEETLEKTGKYEWTTGPGPNKKFTGATKALTLQAVGGAAVTCTASTSAGEYTGPKTQTVTLTLTGCQQGPKGKGVSCQSSGAGAGEIRTASLDGVLEFIKENEEPETPLVGVEEKPASGSQIASFECGGRSIVIGGSVIVPVTVLDKMAPSFKLKALATAGLQSPEAFEVGPKDTLTLQTSGGGAEQAGLNEEPLEIKAEL